MKKEILRCDIIGRAERALLVAQMARFSIYLLKHPIVIKPDLTPEERQRDSILLKERWTLIQSGVPRNSIRIRDSRLFVKNKLFGHVDHSKFQFSSDNPSSALATNRVSDSLSGSGDSRLPIVLPTVVATSQLSDSPTVLSPRTPCTISTSPSNLMNSAEQALINSEPTSVAGSSD